MNGSLCKTQGVVALTIASNSALLARTSLHSAVVAGIMCTDIIQIIVVLRL